MKRINIFFYLFIGLLVYFLIASSASAHVLETDGTIGAVMHIDPNDDPVARQQASFFFAFKDTTNRFNPKNCDCKIAILENGQTIYAQPLFQNSTNPSLESASMFYTFPISDVYQIVITGTPISKNAFQSFKLTYNVRVEQPAGSSTPSQKTNLLTANVGFVIAGFIIAIFLIAKVLRQYKRNKNIHPKS